MHLEPILFIFLLISFVPAARQLVLETVRTTCLILLLDVLACCIMRRACAATDLRALSAQHSLGLEHACSTTGRQACLPALWHGTVKRFRRKRGPWRRTSLKCSLEDGSYYADLARLMDGPDVTLFRFACLFTALPTTCKLLYNIPVIQSNLSSYCNVKCSKRVLSCGHFAWAVLSAGPECCNLYTTLAVLRHLI